MIEDLVVPDVHDQSHPKILFTDTNRWAVTARLATTFMKMECNVGAVCPLPGHPLQAVKGVSKLFSYSGYNPTSSLRAAIEAFEPDFVIPSCDRGVRHLHELHAACVRSKEGDSGIAGLIERSLGSAVNFPIVASRSELLSVAQSEGILTPSMRAIDTIADLRSAATEFAFPWVIKADGTWGGRGVRMIRDLEEAERSLLELTKPAGSFELLKRLALNRDRGWVLLEWKRSRPSVIAQSLIDGRPANCAVACWQGKVLAGIAVEVVRAQGLTGPSTVVQVVEGREMLLAAQRIARRLGITGFFGLDFMIDNRTGDVYLIEMNPRCTPPCPLIVGKGRDLTAAICAQIANRPIPDSLPVTMESRVAYFPNMEAENSQLNDPSFEDAYYDIPAGQPELVDALLHPWSERSAAGRLYDFLRQGLGIKRTSPIVFGASPGVPDQSIEMKGTLIGNDKNNS